MGNKPIQNLGLELQLHQQKGLLSQKEVPKRGRWSEGVWTTSYGGLPSLHFLEGPLFQRGETGLAGGGRLDDPEDDVEKSMGAS